MDSLAVSVTSGFIIRDLRLRHALRISFSFGFFQALMPLLGWAAGLTARSHIQRFDHWIVFGLLAFIGARMIAGGCSGRDSGDSGSCLDVSTLLMMSIATSIDALAVGLSFAMLDLSILFPIAVIGGVTFANCLVGIHLGNRFGHLFSHRLEVVGGIILVIIGVKILVEHLVYDI